MKNLLIQDPPDQGLRTRDKSFFHNIPCVLALLADWTDGTNKLWGIVDTFGCTFGKPLFVIVSP